MASSHVAASVMQLVMLWNIAPGAFSCRNIQASIQVRPLSKDGAQIEMSAPEPY